MGPGPDCQRVPGDDRPDRGRRRLPRGHGAQARPGPGRLRRRPDWPQTQGTPMSEFLVTLAWSILIVGGLVLVVIGVDAIFESRRKYNAAMEFLDSPFMFPHDITFKDCHSISFYQRIPLYDWEARGDFDG